jgi:chromate reductase, NAD(P)H dehydrogenase (quinone)
MNVLCISGSVRAASTNSALLRAAVQLAPKGMSCRVFGGVGELPIFNPDLETQIPASVRALHREIEWADALVVASPEYAHGITGAMKNLLDWLVGFEPFAGKPVLVLNASARATIADAALREVLATMSAALVPAASIMVPLTHAHCDEHAILSDETFTQIISGGLQNLANQLANVDESLTRNFHPL